jgi:hypothetical protein
LQRAVKLLPEGLGSFDSEIYFSPTLGDNYRNTGRKFILTKVQVAGALCGEMNRLIRNSQAGAVNVKSSVVLGKGKSKANMRQGQSPQEKAKQEVGFL